MTAYNRDVADLVFMNNFHFIQPCRKHIETGGEDEKKEETGVNYSYIEEM